MSVLSQKGTGRRRGKGGRGGVPDMDELMSMLGNMETWKASPGKSKCTSTQPGQFYQ
jgi:hypothetical protein